MPAPDHLVIAPILVPLFAGALMLLYDERRRRLKLGFGLASCVLQLVVAAMLVLRAEGTPETGGNAVVLYLLGDWPSPYGIVLVLDRLSAIMLLLTAALSVPAALYGGAGWHRAGQHYQSLFQFLLMGINGAFLTGDLFNLFVFFEVMLAASYGLLLHGSGRERVGAGLHYVAINLTASLLFLLGVATIYGVTGTLNMADLALRLPGVAAADRPLLHAAAVLLALVFLVKAASWPLCFWLPRAYAAAAAPVAAMFAVLTKIGAYAVIRLGLLLFGAGAGASAGFGALVLILGGMATITFGMFGVLAAQTLARMAGNLILVSSGTMLAVTGFALGYGDTGMLAGALYYMLASTLGGAALFLLSEPMSRNQGAVASMLALSADAAGIEGLQDDEEEDHQAGLVLPGAVTLLEICFALCVLLLAGLPPMAGFVGKFAMLKALLLRLDGAGVPPLHWAFLALMLVSGFATLIGLARIGMQTLWAADEDIPEVLALEVAPIALLIGAAIVLTIKAEPVMRYMENTAAALSASQIYIGGVVTAPPVAANGTAAP